MISICDKHTCCGCEACLQICPKHCIKFVEDSEGFYYPSVETRLCINCGLCEKVCPMLNHQETSSPINVYAAKNRNEEELISSSSGGLFIIIAKRIINDGGVVFGARFDDSWNVVHSYTETIEGLCSFMGSKYVQSRIGNAFTKTEEFLKQGRKVLFTGTSCQILALKNYLRHDYDNLFSIDVICHGVPSPGIWRQYLKEEIVRQVEKNSVLPYPISKKDVLIKDISFRNKSLGWKKFSFVLTLAKATADGEKNSVLLSRIHREDPYMQLFLNDLILRPSCFHCPAKGGRSQSDLTIADYWGIECSHPEFYDERGVGLLIVNTQKGLGVVDFRQLDFIETTIEEATMRNRSYFDPKMEPEKRKQFFKKIRYKGNDLTKISKELLRDSFFVQIKRKVKKLIQL